MELDDLHIGVKSTSHNRRRSVRDLDLGLATSLQEEEGPIMEEHMGWSLEEASTQYLSKESVEHRRGTKMPRTEVEKIEGIKIEGLTHTN
jgi:hypothetical protein